MLRWVVSLLATSALACGGFGQWSPEDSGVEPGDAKASADTGSPGYDANIANPSDAGTSDVLVASDADYSTPEVCTSGVYWTLGTTKSASMQPGIACRSCHVVLGQASSYDFDISGTVYPTAHEPDQCNGVADPMNVVITDANGTDHVLPVNNVGNFYNNDALGFLKIPTPYTAKVVSDAGTRPMISAQTNGDCNSCHTEAGTMLAPGRIMAP